MSSNLTKRKKEIQKQLNEIAEQERKELIETHYPEFKKLVGKYFKTRNGYGSDTPKWWLYVKVTEIKPEDVYDTCGKGATCHFKGYSFQTTCYGHFSVEMISSGYMHSLGKEITEGEFNEAWNKAMGNLEKLV
jgi:hypothetical protein